MKLIIIHGPPAAGKFTVGTELARLTGFRLFHNHVSIDCAKSVFEFGSSPFWRAIEKIRVAVISEAAMNDISLIHTFCYEFGVDDEQFGRMITAVEDNGGEVHLVLLRCDDEERRTRMPNDSRVKIGKLTDPDAVGRNKIDLTSQFPGRETLTIDTTSTPPEESAARIIAHYRLEQYAA